MDRSKRIALLVVLGLVIVCCGGGMLVVTTATGRALSADRDEIAAAQALGMPIEPEDLRGAPVPPGQNAAPIYTQVAEMLGGRLQAPQKDVSTALGKKATEDQRRAGDEAMVALKPALDLAKGIDKRPGCDFHRNWDLGPSLLFPEYAGMKGLTKDYCYEADRADLNGDLAGSKRAMARAYRVMDDADADPILISLLVNIACHLIIDRELERLIQRHASEPAYLEWAKASILAHLKLPSLRRHLGGEVVMGRMAIRSMNSPRDIDGSDDPSASPPPNPIQKSIYRSPLVQGTFDERLLWAWRLAWTQFPKDTQDWVGFKVAMAQMTEAVDKDHSLGNVLNRILMPVFDQAIDAVGTMQAHDRMLLTSLALLNTRIATGKFPAVTPDSLGSLRIDPFDGNPLRYRKSDDGFIVYSIGRDRVDNGGHVRSTDDPAGTGFDEVVEFH